MGTLLHARQITVGPRRQPRLDGLDLELAAGDRVALLGVNGAGKSTLLQVLAGALAPDRGVVLLDGQVLAGAATAMRRRIGFLPQRVPAYPDLTVAENLHWAGRLRGLRGDRLRRTVAESLENLGLSGLAPRLAGRLSSGMRRRLGLAQAALHAPDLLILDEPTAGLDPLQAEQLRDLLGRLSQRRSLVLATHVLEDVQRLCDRAVVLDRGAKTAEHPVDSDSDLLGHLRAIAGGDAAATP